MQPRQTIDSFYAAFARLDAGWTLLLRRRVRAPAARTLRRQLERQP